MKMLETYLLILLSILTNANVTLENTLPLFESVARKKIPTIYQRQN